MIFLCVVIVLLNLYIAIAHQYVYGTWNNNLPVKSNKVYAVTRYEKEKSWEQVQISNYLKKLTQRGKMTSTESTVERTEKHVVPEIPIIEQVPPKRFDSNDRNNTGPSTHATFSKKAPLQYVIPEIPLIVKPASKYQYLWRTEVKNVDKKRKKYKKRIRIQLLDSTSEDTTTKPPTKKPGWYRMKKMKSREHSDNYGDK